MSRNSTPGLPLHHAQSKMQTMGFSSSDSRGSSPLPSSGKPRSRSQSRSRDPALSITSAYSILTKEQTIERLSSSLASGLSPTEAIKRLHEYGPNELPREEPEPLWARFLKQFQETLILLLLGSAGISFLMGNLEDAISIGAAVTIVVTVGFVQEYRSEKSLEALSQLVPHSAHVIRNSVDQTLSRDNRILDNGIELSVLAGDMASSQEGAGQTTTTIPAGQLVPGDLVIFNTGDRIPADLRITQSADLSIDESNLTGENEPVSKSPPSVTPQGSARVDEQPQHLAPQYYESSITGSAGGIIRLNEQSNIAFMGTLVRSGHGQGIVVGTGGNTAFGAISASLQEIESPRTPLQLSMDRLGKELSYMSFGVIGFIMLLGLWRGWKFLEMFQIGVSLAVAAIPEGLPIIVTVTLALGVLRMSKKDAIVRRLPSVETLGSVNVVCSDKTGTLTTNHMTVTKLWYLDEKAAIDVSQIHGSTTLNPATRTIIRIGNIVNNSRLVDGHSTSRSAVSSAAILSSMGADDTSHVNSRWQGQPTDVALLDLMDVLGEEDVRERLGGRRSEMPFSSERKWMGVITQGSAGNPSGAEVAFIKGALEKVLSRCDTYLTADGREVILDSQRRTEVSLAAEFMASDGLRVLGFASGQIRGTGGNNSWGRTNGSASDKSIPSPDEDLYRGLVFAGLVGIHDPPRKGVDKSIRRLMAGGVKVIMITGDSETTAVAIGKKLGMPINMTSAIGRPVLRGDEIDSMSEEELMQAIGTTTIFARTTPEHKMQIIKALQARGDVVAMTGDGVNDAPALKKADIGVSMGTTGTDVAKEAADMILIDDNFSTILSAIEEGKGIFYNIQNFLTFQLSTSAAALSLVLLSTVFGLKNPLNAMQILWINILMDGPPAQSLGVEPVDPAVMMRRPRSRNARVLTKPLIQRVLQSASIIMFGTLMTYVHEMNADGQVTARDTTMTFTCFVLFDMFNALTCRSEEKSVLAGEIGLFSNKMFNYSVSGSLIGQAAVIYLPPLQRIFQTEALSLMDLVHLIAVASCVFWTDEGRKFYKRWKRGRALVGYSTNV